MNSTSLECPRCGGPPAHTPVDPSASIACPWCGARYERIGAEKALRELRNEIGLWLEKATGAAAGLGGADAVDVATRSFLFNDRILPGIRRDVRRELDEEIGDVLGSPILVPPVIGSLPGFGGEDAVLVTQRERILGLRALRARLDAPEVAAFATSAADKLALARLAVEVDRTMLASNAAFALASSGIAASAGLVRTNLTHLRESAAETAIETATDPGGAALLRAFDVRCVAAVSALDALMAQPPDLAALEACAARLEETANWLLTSESRDLRAALASTGVHRDATAVRILVAIAREASRIGLPALGVVEAMHALAPWLQGATNAEDAIALVRQWTLLIAANRCGATLPVVTDTSWGRAAVEAARQGNEQPGQIDVVLAPFWAMPARHAKAEGFLFVSGKQYEGIAVVPASAAGDATVLLQAQEPMSALVQQAIATPSRPPWPLDAPCVGPIAARHLARKVLRGHDLKNVSIGEATLVYLPIGCVRFSGSKGQRIAFVGPRGVLPYDASHVAARTAAIKAVADRSGG